MKPELILLGCIVIAATAAAWVYEYRVISARRPYDWSSDPPWLSLTVAAGVLAYFLLR